MQDRTQRWSDYQKCDNKQLQNNLDTVCLIQRDEYLVCRCGFKTIRELYPELYKNQTLYQSKPFSLKLIIKKLSTHTYIRRESKSNQINLYSIQKSIPKAYAYQDVIIKLDLETNYWIIIERNGKIIYKFLNDFITHNNIIKLSICKRT